MQHLLFLHGAIGAKDQLEPLATELKSKFHVHCIDFNGHGKASGADKNFSIEGFAHDVIKFLDNNNIERAAIFGYSMGGYVALWLAKNYPQKLVRIITLATKFHWDEATAAREVKMLNADTIEEKIAEFAAQLNRRHGPNWKLLLEKTKHLLLQLGNSNILQIADYACISTPCLLLLGENDKMISQEETTAVHKALPDAKYISLPNTSHPIERLDLPSVADIIRKFLLQQ